MQVFINNKNEMIKEIQKYEKLNQAVLHYYLSHNRIYKEVAVARETTLFKYNKSNGKFDRSLDIIENIKFEDDFIKISRLEFYTEVLNIIKRRTLLGYMINEYKNLNLDFKELYTAETTHKIELAELISKKMKTNFTKIDVAILIENICKSTKIPPKFRKEITSALIATFYNKELEYSKIIRLVKKIIEKELEKKLPEFTNKSIWEQEYQKMMQTRKSILALYGVKVR